MILGVGIDVVEVQRMADGLRKEFGLKQRLFTPTEVSYCESHKHHEQRFAARFAAKEAFAKALGTGIGEGVSFQDIEIIQENSGRPRIQLHGRAQQIADSRGVVSIHLSITHTEERAAAIVILE